MAAMAVFPGLFFCFAAMVLLIFVSVSVPTWHAISFLNVGLSGPNQLRYGVFGYTGSGVSVGYNFADVRVNTKSVHSMTYVLILHPIAAGFACMAFLFGLCGLSSHRSGALFMALSSAFACLITLIAWIVDMALFSVARHKYRDFTIAAYGNALWMTLGALISLFIASVLGCLGGTLGRFRANRNRVK